MFIFQAEDGMRDYKVTGVQTCALPILGADSVAGVLVASRAGTAMCPVITESTPAATALRNGSSSTASSRVRSAVTVTSCMRSEERRVGEAGRERVPPRHTQPAVVNYSR